MAYPFFVNHTFNVKRYCADWPTLRRRTPVFGWRGASDQIAGSIKLTLIPNLGRGGISSPYRKSAGHFDRFMVKCNNSAASDSPPVRQSDRGGGDTTFNKA